VTGSGEISDAGRERNERIRKLEALRELGINPYPYRFQRTHGVGEAIENEESLAAAETRIAIAGRVMSIRKHGHTSFGNLKDDTGSIQFYLRDDGVDELDFKVFKLIDVGDIIGLWGILFRTRTGELTIRVSKLVILSKSLRPLPEKFHGLQDKEIRYRQRYVDLIVNDEVTEVFRMRSKIIETARQFLISHGFIEVETPILQPMYGGALARPFVTHHNALGVDLYLRIADELYLKRLVVGGLERVFEFSKDFRNEGMDRSHNPEFTVMEIYVAYKDYKWMMEFTEEMIEKVVLDLHGTTKILFGDKTIDFSRPFKRITMIDAIKEYAGIDVDSLSDKKVTVRARDTMEQERIAVDKLKEYLKEKFVE